MRNYDVVVIGGGPAGLSSALSATKNGAKTLIIERESSLGGILKQCIHDGFGLVRFKEKLSGPEYAERFIESVEKENIEVLTLAFVTRIEKEDNSFKLFVVTKEGIIEIVAKTIILSTGCRERTAKQVFIHGTRPAGVFTAGTAQHYVNLLGVMPTKKCVILGSGDIGLIMARRLTLEGGEVLGVYEAKSTPSGLTRNIHQCLHDFNIPLYLSTTVTRVFGDGRLTGVEICQVDENMKPILGTEKIVQCDALILSVGLIPENELGEKIGVEIDKNAKGAKCDGQFQTTVSGVFTCGNGTHVNDLVDYVSESGEIAGLNASNYTNNERKLVDINITGETLYLVPEMIDINQDNSKVIAYFRSKKVMEKGVVSLKIDGKKVLSKKYSHLKPPEMQRMEIDFSKYDIFANSVIEFDIQEEEV